MTATSLDQRIFRQLKRHALREACYSEFADRIIIVEYELITHRPAEVFNLIYEFLGEEPYEHEFEAVEYDASQFDAQLGLDGLHRVHREVKPRPRETILPPDLFERYSKIAFWRNLQNSKAFRIVAQQSDETQQETMPVPAHNVEEGSVT